MRLDLVAVLDFGGRLFAWPASLRWSCFDDPFIDFAPFPAFLKPCVAARFPNA
jgi:hypothetical protein